MMGMSFVLGYKPTNKFNPMMLEEMVYFYHILQKKKKKKSKMSICWWCYKSHLWYQVNMIHYLTTMNICTKFHGNSNICQDISV